MALVFAVYIAAVVPDDYSSTIFFAFLLASALSEYGRPWPTAWATRILAVHGLLIATYPFVASALLFNWYTSVFPDFLAAIIFALIVHSVLDRESHEAFALLLAVRGRYFGPDLLWELGSEAWISGMSLPPP
ncbi:hypothetical protein HK405_002129 [Cladochytrium tenue]|nr:hypothetical protein HK405_002129 [Cladochytrium tenue]